MKTNNENIDDFFKPKNLKSREEKYLKEKEKLREIYFLFYDHMQEPERSELKNIFDIEYAICFAIPNQCQMQSLMGLIGVQVKAFLSTIGFFKDILLNHE